MLPEAVASVWFCGSVVVLTMWWMHWRRVAVVVREATEAEGAREVEVLRRLEQDAGMQPVQLLLSASRRAGSLRRNSEVSSKRKRVWRRMLVVPRGGVVGSREQARPQMRCEILDERFVLPYLGARKPLAPRGPVSVVEGGRNHHPSRNSVDLR
jgi:hypothetical protein